MQLVLTPELILQAYRHGLFPMAHSSDSPYVQWICPEDRGQLPIRNLHIPRRLKKTIRKGPYQIKTDTQFRKVMELCAEPHQNRPETWINAPLIDVFCQLHKQGHAHSVECWDGDRLVGGVYGLALGGAFCGESMFSRARDASKIALVHLTARLWKGGFVLFDTQFINDHLKQFGVYEIPHEQYVEQLEEALHITPDFSLPHMTEHEIIADYLKAPL